jgi:ATP-dependent helicase/nuclease subunit A
MKLTETQAAVITHRGSNLLVSASAGAGKTEVLARRCVALLSDPAQPCGIEQLLVVTFTRAAAAELRVRIARMLRDQAANVPSGELRRHLRRQEMLVPAAEIGTIDAWCGRIVREHYAAAGVDVRFTTLSDEDARLLRTETLDELFTWIYAAADPLADEARVWLARAAAPGDEFLRALLHSLNRFREHLVNPGIWFERQRELCAGDDSAALLAAALAEECTFQHQQLSALLSARAATDVPSELLPYRDQLVLWQRALGDPAALLNVVAEIAAFKLPKPGRGRTEAPEVTEVRKRWLGTRLQETWAPKSVQAILAHGPAAAAHAATLLRLEQVYHDRLFAAKQQRAAYEFGDVLRFALDLLGQPTAGGEREPNDIARRLQHRYAHILVDEYQDTSPVQVEILRLVTRTEPGRSNRFMVGDVKQSIYGFREAEPRLFSALADAYEGGQSAGRVAYLSDNFRSHADLLSTLNELFTRLFDRRLGGTAYAQREWLQPGRAAQEIPNPLLDGQPRVTVHVLEQSPRRGRPDDDDAADGQDVELIEREAQLAANEIQRLLRTGVQIPERGPDDRVALRPLHLADIVILLRSAVHAAAQVARVLRDNGIACATGGRESMLEVVEVRDVCNVLALLTNRRQDIPLAAYLRSPLVGLSAGELLDVRTACDRRGVDYYTAVEHYRRTRPAPALAAKLDAALAQLDEWNRVAREAELPALLRRIFRDSGLPLFAAARRDGAQRVGLLRALQNYAAAFASAGQGNVDDFATYLEQLAAEEIQPASLAPGHEDAVRILTIHGAKGLEFPVVFLLGAGTKFNARSRSEALQCDAQVGFGLRLSDYPARATLRSARHYLLAHQIAQSELEEELRLLYVAVTRARERLIIVGHATPGGWDTLRQTYADRAAPPPLITRLNVANRLEWLLLAAASLPETTRTRLIDVRTQPAAEILVPEPGTTSVSPQPVDATWQSEDEAWVREGYRLLSTDVGSVLADFPAVMSVSALKEHAARSLTADRPRVLNTAGQPLASPAFASGGAGPDGREFGTACHRFLELADFQRLGAEAEVAAQTTAFVAAGRLTPAQAALLSPGDIVWLAGTPEGRLIATGPVVRREVPFVYALPLDVGNERTIIRGVIDCVVETPAGLVIFDYKTDAVRDEADFATRLAGYTVQIQLYARAAGAIFTRPVVRAALAFLRLRRVVDVPLANPSRDAMLA